MLLTYGSPNFTLEIIGGLGLKGILKATRVSRSYHRLNFVGNIYFKGKVKNIRFGDIN